MVLRLLLISTLLIFPYFIQAEGVLIRIKGDLPVSFTTWQKGGDQQVEGKFQRGTKIVFKEKKNNHNPAYIRLVDKQYNSFASTDTIEILNGNRSNSLRQFFHVNKKDFYPLIDESYYKKNSLTLKEKSFGIDRNGKEIEIPVGVRIIPISSETNGDVSVVVVDKNRNYLGNYQISAEQFGKDIFMILGHNIKDLDSINKKADLFSCIENLKLPKAAQNAPSKLKRINPYKEKDSIKNPYKHLMNLRPQFLKQGRKKCLKLLRAEEQKIYAHSNWKNIKVQERGDKIYQSTKNAYKNMIATKTNGKVKGLYKQYADPHYIHPMLSPELATCISMWETRGQAKMNPFSYNETYCSGSSKKSPVSTAYSMAQATSSTIKGLLKLDMFPLTSKATRHLKGQSRMKIFEGIMANTDSQAEAIFRVLNEKAKYMAWTNPKMNIHSREFREKVIAYYDQQGKSKYIKAVLKACMPEMKNKTPTFNIFQAYECINLPKRRRKESASCKKKGVKRIMTKNKQYL